MKPIPNRGREPIIGEEYFFTCKGNRDAGDWLWTLHKYMGISHYPYLHYKTDVSDIYYTALATKEWRESVRTRNAPHRFVKSIYKDIENISTVEQWIYVLDLLGWEYNREKGSTLFEDISCCGSKVESLDGKFRCKSCQKGCDGSCFTGGVMYIFI